MFILNKEKNAIFNVRNIEYIELEDNTIWVSVDNEYVELGEYETNEDAELKFKRILSELGTYDNQIFIEM